MCSQCAGCEAEECASCAAPQGWTHPGPLSFQHLIHEVERPWNKRMVFTSKVEPKTKKKAKFDLPCFFLPELFCFLWAHSPRVSMRLVVCTFTFPSVASSAFPSCVRTICGWWFSFEAATGICCSSGKERRQTIKVHGGQPPFPQLTLSLCSEGPTKRFFFASCG